MDHLIAGHGISAGDQETSDARSADEHRAADVTCTYISDSECFESRNSFNGLAQSEAEPRYARLDPCSRPVRSAIDAPSSL